MLLEDEASGRQANLCLRIPVRPHRTGGSGHNAVLKCVAVATKMLVERLSGKQIALWVSSVFSALLLVQGFIVNGYLTVRPPLTEEYELTHAR